MTDIDMSQSRHLAAAREARERKSKAATFFILLCLKKHCLEKSEAESFLNHLYKGDENGHQFKNFKTQVSILILTKVFFFCDDFASASTPSTVVDKSCEKIGRVGNRKVD